MNIVFHYDSENDSCYVGFGLRGLEAGAVKRSMRATDDITLDLDDNGRLIDIDVMNASRNLPEDLSRPVGTDDVVGVKEAAEMAGVRRSNFVRDLAGRDDFPPPIAELATGRIWLRSDVARYVTERREKGLKRARRSA